MIFPRTGTWGKLFDASVPNVSITSTNQTVSEPGSDTASFTVTRSGVTNAPLRVSYTIGGTAVNGVDYNAISNFAVIPSGSFSQTVTLTPKDDGFVEGPETISISLTNTPSYNAGPATNVLITLSDNESSPASFALQIITPTNGIFDLTLGGDATRLFAVESSSNFSGWQPFATLITTTNTARLLELIPTNAPFLFFRAKELE